MPIGQNVVNGNGEANVTSQIIEANSRSFLFTSESVGEGHPGISPFIAHCSLLESPVLILSRHVRQG